MLKINRTEVVILITISIILLMLLLPAIKKTKDSDSKIICQNNLRLWGQVFSMYSSESKDYLYPPIHIKSYSNKNDDLNNNAIIEFRPMPLLQVIYPDYNNCISSYVCNSIKLSDELTSDDLFTNDDTYKLNNYGYFYCGYNLNDNVEKETEMLSDFPMIISMLESLGFDEETRVTKGFVLFFETIFNNIKILNIDQSNVNDINICINSNQETKNDIIFARLSCNYNKDNINIHKPEDIWVMLDMYGVHNKTYYFNHIPGGSNVLFLDGSVRYIMFGTKNIIKKGQHTVDISPVQEGMAPLMYLFGRPFLVEYILRN